MEEEYAPGRKLCVFRPKKHEMKGGCWRKKAESMRLLDMDRRQRTLRKRTQFMPKIEIRLIASQDVPAVTLKEGNIWLCLTFLSRRSQIRSSIILYLLPGTRKILKRKT